MTLREELRRKSLKCSHQTLVTTTLRNVMFLEVRDVYSRRTKRSHLNSSTTSFTVILSICQFHITQTSVMRLIVFLIFYRKVITLRQKTKRLLTNVVTTYSFQDCISKK